MKRKLDGIIFNTEASVEIAWRQGMVDYAGRSVPAIVHLYQTRRGRFFLAEEICLPSKPAWRLSICGSAEAWMAEGGKIEVLRDIADASKDDGKGKTAAICLRMPAALKRQIDREAEVAGLPTNTWLTRVVMAHFTAAASKAAAQPADLYVALKAQTNRPRIAR